MPGTISAVQGSEVFVGESVSELQFGSCGLLLWRGWWLRHGIDPRDPGWGGPSAVGGRCHAPTGENIAY